MTSPSPVRKHDLGLAWPALAAGTLALLTVGAAAAPVPLPWPSVGPNDLAGVGAARLGGIIAVTDAYENSVEVRDFQGRLRRTITAAEITALLPWMQLDGGPDGPGAVAVSDSGRQVFVLVHDDTAAPDGGPNDGVLLYDTGDDTLQLFARMNLFHRGDELPHLAVTHCAGRLYVGTAADGLHVYAAGINQTTGTLLNVSALPGGGPVRGLAADPQNGWLFAGGTNQLFRAAIPAASLTFQTVGPLPGLRALAHSTHFGGPNQGGLYALGGTGAPQLFHVPSDQAAGTAPFAPVSYLSVPARDVAATACGRLLLPAGSAALQVSDSSDARLGFTAWLEDEFQQHLQFIQTLIAADGRGPGWVTDADTEMGRARFHPCSPDGAAWAVFGLLLADVVQSHPAALPLTRDILRRHAGQAADGIAPQRTPDGIYRHWYNPATGGAYPGWDPEFATMSTMKILHAAVRARQRFRDDPGVVAAAAAMLDSLAQPDAYVRDQPDGMFFRALPGGGPDLGSGSLPFHEGILFVELAAAWADAAVPRYARWLDRARWPTATLLAGKPVTGDQAGRFQAAFVSLYPWLLQRDVRDAPTWRQNLANLWLSHAAWNDAHAPRWFTVFSAGTSPEGYHADSLSHHPWDIATFPALLAFAADGNVLPAASAYHAYRTGARQTFAGGASLLYRRANALPGWQPDSAGLPDVTLGAFGLAELLHPGTVDALLALDLAGYPLQLARADHGLELRWPLVGGWRLDESTNLLLWEEHPGWFSPHPLLANRPAAFFRIRR
ncbi:MAG: YncE family protein [Limisphaerales bacterium]